MNTTDPDPAALSTRLGALFIDLAIPATLSFAAGVASWVAVNLLWQMLIRGGGIEWLTPEGARALFAPSVIGMTTIGTLGPALLWCIAELWMLGRRGQTWGLREQGLLLVEEPKSGRRIVIKSS